jgi:hypothetical protein
VLVGADLVVPGGRSLARASHVVRAVSAGR